MFESTAKKNVLGDKRNTYVSRCPAQEQTKAQRQLLAYDVRTCIKTGAALQRQKRDNQAVIQREPYDAYKAVLSGIKEVHEKIQDLINKLQTYTDRKASIVEEISRAEIDKKEGSAELLYMALEISELAG